MVSLPLGRPLSAASRRRQVVLKRRLRSFYHRLRSPQLASAAVFAVLTAVCVLLLSLADPVPPAFPLPASAYWHSSIVSSAGLRRDSYPPPEDLHVFISRATRYIIRANAPAGDGKFAYQYVLDGDIGTLSSTPAYNTLRHSGAAYALADACLPADAAAAPHCRGARGALTRAATWLAGTAAPLPGRRGVVGLVSRAADENPLKSDGHSKPDEVRAGGLGLGLVALTAGARAGAGAASPRLLRAVARFATDVMQRDDGGLYSYFNMREGALDARRFNRFYAGEAALGLTRLHGLHPNATLVDRALRAMEALADERADMDEGDVPCDHWALIATGNLVRDAGVAGDDSAAGRARLRKIMAHARTVLRSCAARDRMRVPGTTVRANSWGCAVEAQMNVLPLLAELGGAEGRAGVSMAEARDVFCVAQHAVGGILAMQYRKEQPGVAEKDRATLDGAVPGSGSLRVAWRDGKGRVRERDSLNGVFQIDTTQHTLSAVLAYVRVCRHPLFKDVVCAKEGPPYRTYVRKGGKVKVED